MYSVWTQHIQDPEEKAKFEDYLKRSKELFSVLSNLIDVSLKNYEQTELTIKDYEDPNWAYKQAFRNGHKAFAARIKDLIDLDKQEQFRERNTVTPERPKLITPNRSY